MSNKALMTDTTTPPTAKPASSLELLERPMEELEARLKEGAGALLTAEHALPEGAALAALAGVNAINKGSKLTGNLVITQDLQITGDVEGDITSEEGSNIFIKGTCKGNIKTAGGSVEIEGDMSGGDIVAGGYVKVTGRFHGGKIQAKEKIHINGEFSGTLESNEIEVGSLAKGTGEIVYKEHLSIQKGANVEGRITRVGQGQKAEAPRKPEEARKPAEQPRSTDQRTDPRPDNRIDPRMDQRRPELERREEPKLKRGFFSK